MKIQLINVIFWVLFITGAYFYIDSNIIKSPVEKPVAFTEVKMVTVYTDNTIQYKIDNPTTKFIIKSFEYRDGILTGEIFCNVEDSRTLKLNVYTNTELYFTEIAIDYSKTPHTQKFIAVKFTKK